MEWRHTGVLDIDTWSRPEIEHVLDQASGMEELLDRPIKKVPALRGKLIVNLFFEPSTRTKVSFELAEKLLSADVLNWSASGSSTSKGETLRDTAWTLEAMGADAVVIRHGAAGAAEYLSRKMKKSSVFNAGDGAHAHPTQALLDLYTARKQLGSLENKRVVFIGDVLHSRVVRSGIRGFRAMGAEVTISGPPTLMPLDHGQLGAAYEPDPFAAAANADILYILRIQKERQEQGMFPSIDEYHRYYGAHDELMEKAPQGVMVMHPGPINRGAEIASSIADAPESLILGQVRSGVAVRMALLYVCLGGSHQ